MGRFFRFLISVAPVLLLIPSFDISSGLAISTWQAKVDNSVLQASQTSVSGEAEFLVYLASQADLSEAKALPTKHVKGRFVVERLKEIAGRTQKPIIAILRSRGVAYRPYWVANMIWVKGDMHTIQTLAQRFDVAHLYANPKIYFHAPMPIPDKETLQSLENVEWNLQQVNADKVWQAGITGVGVIIGGQDTGYDWDHPALKNQYRGWNGLSVDHNYNWHDAIHSGGGSCGANSLVPCDDHGHGTHTMGIMVGDDDGVNQTGLAPGSRWIGCRNMDQGVGTPATYAECYQWFIAPTDLAGQNPRPDLAPHVINNSWGCPPSEGCTDPAVLQKVVENLRAAGIMTVHAAGNRGPQCSTVDDPAAIYQASFTVGNTDRDNTISDTSSRGPVTVDGSARLKPDISAPGTQVRSSWPGGNYATLSGTSIAAPHVSGLAALLISQEPGLAGHVGEIEDLIKLTAVPVNVAFPQDCGGLPSHQIPNNVYGYGRIDAWAAYKTNLHTLEINKIVSAPVIEAGEVLTYTLTLEHKHILAPTYNIVVTDTIPSGTGFITATVPHTLHETVLHWDIPNLEAGESKELELVVRAPTAGSGMIVNDKYGARSDQVQEQISGSSVTTFFGFVYYFPFMYNQH